MGGDTAGLEKPTGVLAQISHAFAASGQALTLHSLAGRYKSLPHTPQGIHTHARPHAHTQCRMCTHTEPHKRAHRRTHAHPRTHCTAPHCTTQSSCMRRVPDDAWGRPRPPPPPPRPTPPPTPPHHHHHRTNAPANSGSVIGHGLQTVFQLLQGLQARNTRVPQVQDGPRPAACAPATGRSARGPSRPRRQPTLSRAVGVGGAAGDGVSQWLALARARGGDVHRSGPRARGGWIGDM
jgi:hypothetical protein